MWQSKREISLECNDIIGLAKGSQISEKYWGKVGKGKRVDVYPEVRKRRGHIFFEWNKCLWCDHIYGYKLFIVYLFLMRIFLMHSLRKSLSETSITLTCNYYCFWHKNWSKGGEVKNLNFLMRFLQCSSLWVIDWP